MSIRRGRRVQVRRACIAVLTGVAAFAVLQLGLAALVELRDPGLRDPLYAARLERIDRRLRADPARPTTVIMLGSSRTKFGFRVGNVEKAWGEALGRPVAAFNFGVNGAGPQADLLNWRRLRRDGVRPDLLLVEVMPPCLAFQATGDFGDVALPTDHLSWHDLPLVERYAGNARPDLRRDWLTLWPAPCYAHRLRLLSLVQPLLLPFTDRRAHDGKVDASELPDLQEEGFLQPRWRLQAMETAHAAFLPLLTGFRPEGPPCAALRELLASSRKDGVPVALVVMPEGPEFRSWYPPKTWPAVREWVGRVSREYDAPVIDAREWIDENGFMDSHHLLAPGAAKFTERLGRECIIPMLRGEKDAGP